LRWATSGSSGHSARMARPNSGWASLASLLATVIVSPGSAASFHYSRAPRRQRCLFDPDAPSQKRQIGEPEDERQAPSAGGEREHEQRVVPASLFDAAGGQQAARVAASVDELGKALERHQRQYGVEDHAGSSVRNPALKPGPSALIRWRGPAPAASVRSST